MPGILEMRNVVKMLALIQTKRGFTVEYVASSSILIKG